jgi:hypothetical protein
MVREDREEAMPTPRVLLEFAGSYGGPASRDEVVRALKEALALVENTARDAELACSGWRIEVLDPGSVEE